MWDPVLVMLAEVPWTNSCMENVSLPVKITCCPFQRRGGSKVLSFPLSDWVVF